MYSRWRAVPVIALIAVLIALAATGGSSAMGASGNAGSHIAAPAMHPVASGATVRIERADIHVDSLPGVADGAIDLAITQTQSDCETPPHGQVCLRYSISVDDAPVEAGYGLIPMSAVTVSPTAIRLSIDTGRDPQLNRLAGKGGLISLTWSIALGQSHPVNQVAALAVASVQGSILGYAVPRTNVTAGVLISAAP